MPRYRFGLYDFDSQSGELRREGIGVRLQAQPAQVLGVLLAAAGRVVSREELRAAVWGTDTFVDFDSGLNFCISQIRGALRDSADSPAYVRTIPKKGYQFVAPVEVIGEEAPVVLAAVPEGEVKPAGMTTMGAQLVALLLALLLFAGFLAWKGWQMVERTASNPLTVAVFRLDNDTGDAGLDRTGDILTDSLIAELTTAGAAAHPPYTVIGNAAPLRQPRAQRDILSIGTGLGAQLTLSGSLRRRDGGVEVFWQLIRLPDQRHLRVVVLPIPEDRPPAAMDVAGQAVAVFGPLLRPQGSR